MATSSRSEPCADRFNQVFLCWVGWTVTNAIFPVQVGTWSLMGRPGDEARLQRLVFPSLWRTLGVYGRGCTPLGRPSDVRLRVVRGSSSGDGSHPTKPRIPKDDESDRARR